MEESEEILDVKTWQYMLNSYNVVKHYHPNTRFNEILPKIADREAQKSLKKSHCKYCCQPWNEGHFTLKVLPKPVIKNRTRKMLRKKVKSPGKLTKFENKFLQFVENNQGNKLVLMCLRCKKKTIKSMHKHNHKVPDEHEEEQEQVKKVKKKKRKNIFAGLNPQEVLKIATVSKNIKVPLNININVTRKETVNFKKLNVNNLNEKRENQKLLASSQKRDQQKLKKTSGQNIAQTYIPDHNMPNQNTSTYTTNNSNSKIGTFFHKLETEKKRKIKVSNEMRKRLGKQIAKSKKSNSTDFKNFLKDFGNPVDV